MKSAALIFGLLLLLGIVAGAMVTTMSFLAHQTSIGTVAQAATPTPALSDSFALSASSSMDNTARSDSAIKPRPTPVPYNSNSAMYQVFAGFELTPGYGPLNDRTLNALAAIRENNDTSQVRVIIESLRFLYANDVIAEAVSTLEHLTGQDSIGDDWKKWSEWFGRHQDEYPVPEEYADWKLNYLRQIDGRFGAFLSPALKGQSNVDLKEVEWGGVIPDGIPPLENPGHAPADDPLAEFLEDDERVIGVTINGEHRAYPLRIVNAHELVNDVLGGEPLSLTW